MHLVRLTSREDKLFPAAMALYRESFPRHEQREPVSQQRVLDCQAYHFAAVCDEERFVGLLLYWDAPAFLYVEHFCIVPELRNRGYGQRALALLNGRAKPVILEIDPPVDDLSRRRKGFYERAGYRANVFAHVHPPYHEDCQGHVLVVMSCPDILQKEQYDGFFAYLRDVVMGECL